MIVAVLAETGQIHSSTKVCNEKVLIRNVCNFVHPLNRNTMTMAYP